MSKLRAPHTEDESVMAARHLRSCSDQTNHRYAFDEITQ